MMRFRGLAVLGVAVLALNSAVPAQAAPLAIAVSGTNGVGTSEVPGTSCAAGGTGANWHYDYASAIPGGRFSSLPGELRLHLNLHSEPDSLTPTPSYSNAFLLGDQSETWLSNARGAVRLALRSGTCADQPLSFDGVNAAGSGTWTLVGGSGAYRDATGNGTFSMTAAVAPGADNPFQLQLAGGVDVLQPELRATTVGAAWGNLSLAYVSRTVTVTYRVTNTGVGDAFGVRVTGVTSLTRGAVAKFTGSRQLGDLPSGESETFSVRYQLGYDAPCTLVIANCTFSSRLTFDLADALDQPITPPPATVRATAPVLPL